VGDEGKIIGDVGLEEGCTEKQGLKKSESMTKTCTWEEERKGENDGTM
jgi:hypothetical protein